MSHFIQCIYFQDEKEPIADHLPMGVLGDFLRQNISQEAWSLWKAQQIKLINEYRLAPHTAKDKAFLKDKMIDFLKISQYLQ